MQHLLALQFIDVRKKVPVYVGLNVCVADDYRVQLERVLWDSGALHSSYISQQWLDRHREVVGDKVRNSEMLVRLGDNKTQIR